MISDKGTRPLIARAAQSIAQTMGMDDTMIDVLRARAFQPYAESLRQYLIVRLGSKEEGDIVLSDLKVTLAERGIADLLRPPGVRAHLFALARNLIHQRWEQESYRRPQETSKSLPWRRPGQSKSDHYLFVLSRIRKELPSGEAELLELHFARELTLEEIAFVFEDEVGKIELRIDMALAQARQLLGGKWADPEQKLDTLLLEAFALEPLQDTRVSYGSEELTALEKGAIVGGRYEIDEQVGSGGMGNVYRAKDTEVPGHVVALKLLHTPSRTVASRDAALRELRLIASIFHPSVVQFKDHGWFQERLWFVMPWYEGETLQERIEKSPLSRAEARPIFEQIALALSTMHSAGIRHQDIKPENIFLAKIKGVGHSDEETFLPVLLDLGVAAKEAELVLAGTPIYFSPEVAAQYTKAKAPHPVTPKADVFSLCLSLRNSLDPNLYEDVAAGAVERFIHHRTTHSPRSPSSRDLIYLKSSFERWLSTDPEERPTAEELAEELSILTQPEDRRARFLSIMRWSIPLILALAAIFGSIVFGLNRQAEFQKLEAERARTEANLAKTEANQAKSEAQKAKVEVSDMQEDLEKAAERQKALEIDVQQTLARYRSSKFTGEQLTQKLARAEGQVRMVREMYKEEQGKAQHFKSVYEGEVEKNLKANADIVDLNRDLEQNRAIQKTLAATVQGLEADIQEKTESLLLKETELSARNMRISQLEQSISEQEKNIQGIQANLAQARQEKIEAQRALKTAEARIDQLERQIKALKRSTHKQTSKTGGPRQKIPADGIQTSGQGEKSANQAAEPPTQ